MVSTLIPLGVPDVASYSFHPISYSERKPNELLYRHASVAIGASELWLRVVDSANNQPLPDVEIFLDGDSKGVTGADGFLIMTSVTPGLHTVKLSKPSAYKDAVYAVSTVINQINLCVLPLSTSLIGDFGILVSPNPMELSGGGSTFQRSQIIVSSLNGFSSPVSLSFTWIGSRPTGVSISFDKNPLSPRIGALSFDRTLMTFSVSSASAGTFILRIEGKGGGLLHWLDLSVVVITGTLPVFDFALSNSGNITVVQGESASNRISATLLGGSSQPVSLSCSGLPMGASCSFNPVFGNPSFTSILTILTSSFTPTGSYNIAVTGSGGGLSKTTIFFLNVMSATPTSQQLIVRTDQSSYSCGSRVMISVAGTGSLSVVTVAFEVRSPTGSVIATGSGQTDAQGTALMTFTLPSGNACSSGTYTIFASVAGQPTGTATATFSVTTPGGAIAHVKLTLVISDMNGNPSSSFSRGDQVAAKFTLQNDASANLVGVHVLITFSDPSGVPSFFTFAILSVNAGQQQTNIQGFQISTSSQTGSYRIQLIVLTDFLANGGTIIPDGAGTATFLVN